MYVTRTSVGERAVTVSEELHPRDPAVSGVETAVTLDCCRFASGDYVLQTVLCVEVRRNVSEREIARRSAKLS